MKNYMYKQKEIPVSASYDVVVVGGGTAGSTAALASVTEGARTLIIEKNTYLGGSASGGQVTPMMHAGLPGNADSSYINSLLKKRLINEGYGLADPFENDGWFNPEMLKFVLEDIYLDRGGNILYETEFLDTIVEDGTICGIVIHNKGGIQAIEGNMIIDCTGDADVAYSAGVPCFTGDEVSHNNQASSLRFMLGNIDIRKVREYMKSIGEQVDMEFPFIEIVSVWDHETPLTEVFKKGVSDGVLKYEDGVYLQGFSVPGMPGAISFNNPEIQGIYDSLDPVARTNIVITGRKMIKRLFRFLKLYIPGFENSFIMSVASIPGIRESRRITGRYVLSENDYNNRTKFKDAIARTAYPVDIHGLIDEKKLDVKQMDRGEYFEIPFRCLVPVGIDNLLVGGRCISSTFIAQSSIRIQAVCRATGEAAGIAAAYCSKNSLKLGDFSGEIARRTMKEHGAFL